MIKPRILDLTGWAGLARQSKARQGKATGKTTEEAG